MRRLAAVTQRGTATNYIYYACDYRNTLHTQTHHALHCMCTTHETQNHSTCLCFGLNSNVAAQIVFSDRPVLICLGIKMDSYISIPCIFANLRH